MYLIGATGNLTAVSRWWFSSNDRPCLGRHHAAVAPDAALPLLLPPLFWLKVIGQLKVSVLRLQQHPNLRLSSLPNYACHSFCCLLFTLQIKQQKVEISLVLNAHTTLPSSLALHCRTSSSSLSSSPHRSRCPLTRCLTGSTTVWLSVVWSPLVAPWLST